jgi:Ca-activated chloride channel family protein
MKRTIIGITTVVAMVAAACGGSDAVGTTARDAYPTTTAAGVAPLSVYEAEDGLAAGGSAIPNDEPYDLTFFENYGVNPRIDTEDDPLSTFAVDVDTGAYTIARRWIADGNLPDKDSVRVEEYVNYFATGYEAPGDGTFSVYVDGGPTPFAENDRYRYVRIGIQGMIVADEDRPRANLTFVIDVSGSMDREDRLESVKDALGLLVGELRSDDTVGIVVYGSEGRVLLEPTEVADRDRILAGIERLVPEGSTNAEEGLRLAYQMATRGFSENGINRVILCSDGVANVGNTGPDSILETIRAEAGDGIQLVTVGFGMGNYNDVLMEQLADDGDGFYAYVDDLEEAERLFVHGLTGTLFTIAEDTKIQVEFDPETVERWRLIGFENRALADEDFRDDAVDAGEVGAGHHVTALYEIRTVDDAAADAELGTVRLRWLDPQTGEASELEQPFGMEDLSAEWSATPEHFQLAATVAAFAEVLRESYWAQHMNLEGLVPYALRIEELLTGDADVAEFADLVVVAAELASA